MTNTVRALIVPADEALPIEHRDVERSRATMLALVDDHNTDTVFLPHVRALALVAGTGKTDQVRNPRATMLIEFLVPGFAKKDQVHGDAVFVGHNTDADDPADVYCDVTSEVVDTARTHFTLSEQ